MGLFWFLYVVNVVIAVGCAIDAIRHPAHDWAEADHQKGVWVTWLVLSAWLLVPTVVVVPWYLWGVRPRLPTSMESNRFAK